MCSRNPSIPINSSCSLSPVNVHIIEIDNFPPIKSSQHYHHYSPALNDADQIRPKTELTPKHIAPCNARRLVSFESCSMQSVKSFNFHVTGLSKWGHHQHHRLSHRMRCSVEGHHAMRHSPSHYPERMPHAICASFILFQAEGWQN